MESKAIPEYKHISPATAMPLPTPGLPMSLRLQPKDTLHSPWLPQLWVTPHQGASLFPTPTFQSRTFGFPAQNTA